LFFHGQALIERRSGHASAKRRNLHKLTMFPVDSLRPEGSQYTHFGAGVKRAGQKSLGGGGGGRTAAPRTCEMADGGLTKIDYNSDRIALKSGDAHEIQRLDQARQLPENSRLRSWFRLGCMNYSANVLLLKGLSRFHSYVTLIRYLIVKGNPIHKHVKYGHKRS
jgi:hypothetical protein